MGLSDSRWRLVLGAGVILAGGLALTVRLQSPALQRFVVMKGESAREISCGLWRQRLVWDPWSFVLWAKWRGKNGIRPGVYSLSPRMTAYQIYSAFRQGPPVERVTFPEGWTAAQMAALLESRGIVPAAPFLALVQQRRLEGFLFPDTYFFEQGIEPGLVIDRMTRRFHQEEPKDLTARAKALKLSYRQMVTLASLVEKEARVPEERSLIAGVYYNRLRRHMRLEADPTVQYARGGWKPQLSYKDLEIDSPYNTYRHAGLPPGPICNPGAASLSAAARPARTDYLFFVADSTGRHTFTKTYQEHLAVQRGKRRTR